VQELFGPVLLVCSASLYSGNACCRMSCGGIFLYRGGTMARVVVMVSQMGGVRAGSVSWRAVVFCWMGVCPLLGGVLEGEIGVGLVPLWVLGLVEVVSEGWLESVS
jgi:hypothetical protein